MSERVFLGDWTAPSGNNVECYAMPGDEGGVLTLEFEWDTPPPLRAEDEAYYLAIIRPAAVLRLSAYTTQAGGRPS